MNQIFPNKAEFHVLIYFYCKMYIFYCFAAMEIICSKTYFSLLYELFKIEVPPVTKSQI